jgi:hypothetical protein
MMISDWLCNRKAGTAVWLCAAVFLTGCTHLEVDDCMEPGGKVLGEDVPRIRSSHVRMKFDDGRAAAARFAPYAAMSALAYEEASTCPSWEKALKPEDAGILRAVLAGSGSDHWQVVKAISPAGFCQDDIGFSYHVWTRKQDGKVDVVIAFRGTDNDNADDWVYGNLYWLTHWFTDTNQYERAEARTRQIIDYFRTGAGRPADDSQVRFYSTGHSLGGGLAQHVLYALPEDIEQAYAFDPSPVTAHTDTDVRGRVVSACSCLPELGSEARIYRFYESYEVLTHLRFVHKLFFAPNRHIQEVRFGYNESSNAIKRHSMMKLALNVAADAKSEPSRPYAVPWYAGQGARNGRSCTAVFEDAQKQSCAVPANSGNPCPQ